MTTSTNINFPQGPIADRSGYITLEWQQWLQNPTFLSFKFQTVLDVTSGGTGTGTITQHGVLIGNGTSPLGTLPVAATNTILQGNTGADPSFKSTIDNIIIGGTTPASGSFTTLTATTVVATGKVSSASPTAGVGYAAGAGATATQLTDKSSTVLINAVCGTITMNNAVLNAATIVTFTVTNSACEATDVIAIQHDSVGTIGGYTIMPNTPASGSFKVSVRNNTASNLSEAIVLRFAIIKAVVS